MIKPILIAILTIVIFFGVIFGGWAFRYYTAEIRGTVSAEEQIESAESRISNYQFFYDLYHSIQAHERQIAIQEERLEQAREDGADSREMSRIRSNIAGIRAQRENAIERYNSAARQQYTRGRFRAGDLPHQIEN